MPFSPDPSRRSLMSLVLSAASAPALVACGHLGHPASCFTLGVASGCPRPDSIVLWTRLSPDARPAPNEPVRWELAEDEAFRRIVRRGSFTAEADWGHSVHVQPLGLSPGRWYWYRFFAMGQVSATGRTRTAPVPGSLEPVTFAIGSCQRWDHGHYAAWRHLADESPDLVLFLGDYIYEYPGAQNAVREVPDARWTLTLDDYRARYALHKSDADLRAMHAACPWIVTWDDHEVQNDYAADHSPVLNRRFLRRRLHAYRAWWEHMPLPPATRPVGAGLQVFDRFAWGALARFHVLDTRQYRDPQACALPGLGGGNTVDLAGCPALAEPHLQPAGDGRRVPGSRGTRTARIARWRDASRRRRTGARMSLRSATARWFELLTSREELGAALDCLAREHRLWQRRPLRRARGCSRSSAGSRRRATSAARSRSTCSDGWSKSRQACHSTSSSARAWRAFTSSSPPGAASSRSTAILRSRGRP